MKGPFYNARKEFEETIRNIITGDKKRLAEIEMGIAESQKSPYNVAKISEQGQQFFDMSFKDYVKASKLAESGLSQAEKDLATGQFAKSQNFAQQNALNQGGGNLAPYINTVLNSNANDFSVNLAAKDAEVQRQNQALKLSFLNNFGQAASQFNDVNNLNFQKQTMAEQALGAAKQDWYYNRDKNRMELFKTGMELLPKPGNLLSGGGGGEGGGGGAEQGLMMLAQSSDIRLKENIQLERQEKGLNIYSFNYKTDKDKRYEGVMAQEVIETHPEAVIIDEDGYYKVFYSMLGIEMKQIN